MILVATIGQLVRKLGCLADEGLLWRASWRGSAGKQVAVCVPRWRAARWSALCTEMARRGAPERDGVALQLARKMKDSTCFFGPGDGNLVVVAVDVGDQWSEETLGQRTGEELPLMRMNGEACWRAQWHKRSLRHCWICHGGDGSIPAEHAVHGDHRCAVLAPR